MEAKDYPGRVPENTQDYKPHALSILHGDFCETKPGEYKKVCQTGRLELCILVETEYIHWKFQQHWP